MIDPANTLKEVLAEAHNLVRNRLKEHGIEAPHLVVALTSDQVILRSNVSEDGLRSFGEDLIGVADQLKVEPELERTTQ